MLQPTQRKMQIVKKRMPLLLNRMTRLAKKDRRKMREKGGNSQKERKKKLYIYIIILFRKARPSTNLTKRPPRSQVEMAHHINDRISCPIEKGLAMATYRPIATKSFDLSRRLLDSNFSIDCLLSQESIAISPSSPLPPLFRATPLNQHGNSISIYYIYIYPMV